uniref:Uncharacterized protein n=1 Tax=Oryza sativa subsp. japonica TaxID=39947 RepID=Q6EPS2_ORYSJ|nr:hypothetical protein [Oryza sativa Japonica Group]
MASSRVIVVGIVAAVFTAALVLSTVEGGQHLTAGCEKPPVTARLPRLPPVPRGYGYPYRAVRFNKIRPNSKI